MMTLPIFAASFALRSSRISAVLAGLWLAAVPSACAQGPVVTLDPSRTQGAWDGWGTSLCWWAKGLGDRDDLADLLFTAKTVDVQGNPLPGLALNIVRYNVGACSPNEVDGHRMAVSKAILPYRQMESFWLDGKDENPQSPSWDWSADKNQRAMLLKARARGVDRCELFSNSPPWWMCRNFNPSGQADASQDNLAPENYERFAVYLATIARYAKDHWGVSFTSVEAFNEPTSRFWHADCKQEGCHFSAEAQAAILPLLRRELDRRALQNTPVAASDENQYDQAASVWQKYDEPTRALVGQVNVHGYQSASGRREVLSGLTKGKRLWNSEYGENDAAGLQMAHNLHLDLRYLRPSAWCYWQAFDGQGWGLITSDVSRQVLQQANPKYYVLAQYTRHIRPGMTILMTGETETVAAYDPTARRLVLVVENPGAEPLVETCDLSRFTVSDGAAACWLTTPAGAARYARQPDARVAGRRLEISVPAGSVMTVEVENAGPP